MRWNIFLSTAVVAIITVCQACDMALEKFKSEEIVPDVIDQCPQKVLKVLYGSAAVNISDTMTPAATKNRPNVEFEPEEDALYTLCMVDPDAPSRKKPKYREWLHWLVINIPGNKIEEGKVVTKYSGPSPPKGTGPHRYIFLLFKQLREVSEESFPDDIAAAVSSRKSFKTKKFAESQNFGDPNAGNFFLAQS